ncbi:MAG: PQQ-binding-like beta-propeller repeat protein [Candidatus Eremiobacteraeota bacterium]|nr:PQQ-binding-like beta-propeller repeat protein [Candidatus Eremiobacteraeota bacterium]
MKDIQIGNLPTGEPFKGRKSQSTPSGKPVSPGKDEFRSSQKQMKDISGDEMKKFWEDSQKITEVVKITSELSTTPMVSPDVAGWKSKLTREGRTNCFVKIPMPDDSNKMLVIPLQNHAGQDYGKPALVDFDKGVVGIPDVKAFGDAQGFKFAKSPDKKTTYIYNFNSTRFDVYDEKLKKTDQVDLSGIDSSFGKMRDFVCTDSANYVFVSDKDFDNGYLIALDPGTNKMKWKQKFDSVMENEIARSPDGNIYVAMGSLDDGKGVIQVFSPDGKKLKKFKGLEDPRNMVFGNDGSVYINDHRNIRCLDLQKKGKLSSKGKLPKEIWGEKGDFERFELSENGKSLIAIDEKSGFYRSHGMVKFDSQTGKVLWKRDRFGDNYIDHKIVNGEIYLLTAPEKGTNITQRSVRMTKLDMDGKVTWEGTLPTGIDEYEIGKRNAVTKNGNFVFGGWDGNLHCLHPRKEGESEKTIEEALLIGSKENLEFRDADESSGKTDTDGKTDPTIELHEKYVDIGGVRLERKSEK